MRKIVLICCIAVLATGCTRDIESDVYTSSEVDHAAQVYEGVIVSYRTVTVKDQDNVLGAIAGGVLGGVVGNAIGGGRGRNITTVAGALGGAAAGSAAQGALSKQQAIEYIVTVNGEMRKIVQGKKRIYSKGQKVLVSLGSGRPRIVSAI